jgi:hypothetical protein
MKKAFPTAKLPRRNRKRMEGEDVSGSEKPRQIPAFNHYFLNPLRVFAVESLALFS